MTLRICYLPVRLIRLIKAVVLLSPLVVSVYLLVLAIDERATETRLKAEADAIESLHLFLERYSVCEGRADGWSRANDTTTEFNATVVEFCQQFETSQRTFFSRRPYVVNRFNHSIVKDARGICSPNTHMVVLVHSLHNYRERRDAIRRTWGGAAHGGTWPTNESLLLKSFEVRVVFVLGHHVNAIMESRVEEESGSHGDIVQGDFNESYTNMTLKSLLGLKWVLEFCPSVKYLFKCDDDMFVNIYAIVDLLRQSPMTWSIMGPLNLGSRVYRRGKWRLTKEQYPFYYFPPYESGSGYAISADLIGPLLDTSAYVPWLFIDDVYVTGIMGKILGVRHVTQSGFAYWTSKPPSACDISRNYVLTGTKVDPKLQLDIWKQLTDGVHCPDDSKKIPKTPS